MASTDAIGASTGSVVVVSSSREGDHAVSWAEHVADAAGARVSRVGAWSDVDRDHPPALIVVPVSVAGPGPLDRQQRDHLGELARSASSPVAMIPPGDWLGERPVVVGIDGTAANRSVLNWARWSAAVLGQRLIAVHVSKPGDRTLTAGDRPTAEDAAVRHEIDHSGAEFVERQHTHPAASLCDYALIRHAGLLVVGARVRHSLHGRIIGAVTTGVIADAHRPVVVVPREHQLAGT